MFRLISLNINDWNYLGHIPADKLVFLPTKELKKTELPYTSVMIGANGTGKSTLLSYIARIFEDLKYYKENKKRNSNAINFPYSIYYQIGVKKIRITQNHKGIDIDSFKEQDKRVLKWTYYIDIENDSNNEWKNIEFPKQILSVSYLPMDRFRQKKNFPDDFYQYLGLRHRSNAASPQYFLNNTLPLLFDYISKSKSIAFLKEILEFMEIDNSYLGVQLIYRYKKFFFTGNLKAKEFKTLFENPEIYSERKSKSFAVDYYQRYIRNDDKLIEKIVKYLNVRTLQDNISVGEKSLLEFNLFENIELIEELSLIQHLQKLDLLASATLLFKKTREKIIDSQNLSSGEFHFLTTMIAVQATIKDNSLILIDEPDTSLHPNWQMKYIHNLKKLFRKWNSVHFIMATHSHFIISDLENESSEVIGLKGIVPKIEVIPFNLNTYGWSPDEILYKIFGLRTIRNHYFEFDLLQLASQLSAEKKDYEKLEQSVVKLSKYIFSKEDPLNKLITEANKILKESN